VRISLIRRLLIELVQDKTWRGARRAGVLYRPRLPAMSLPAAEQGRTYANSRLRAVRASPRHPIALPPLETIRQSAGLGVAVAAAATSTVGSGAGAAPAARRARGHSRRRETVRRRVAPREPPCRVLWRGRCVCSDHDSPTRYPMLSVPEKEAKGNSPIRQRPGPPIPRPTPRFWG